MSDRWRILEDAAMREHNTIHFQHCRLRGIDEDTIDIWRHGVRLAGHEAAPHYDLMDYPSVLQHPEEAAKELDRLTSDGRIFWYDDGDAPPDLDIGPTTLILKSERARLVHDWTRAGLNQCLETPPTRFDTMDDFLDKLRPNAFMAGLNIRDCFYHWPIHPESRRRLGVRHPISRRLGVYLFLPPGLSAAPGYNEQFVGTMVDAAKRGL